MLPKSLKQALLEGCSSLKAIIRTAHAVDCLKIWRMRSNNSSCAADL